MFGFPLTAFQLALTAATAVVCLGVLSSTNRATEDGVLAFGEIFALLVPLLIPLAAGIASVRRWWRGRIIVDETQRCIYITHDGVTVSTPFDSVRVEVPATPSFPRPAALEYHLADGRMIAAQTQHQGAFRPPMGLRAFIAELDRLGVRWVSTTTMERS